MELTSKQRAQLRGLANGLDTILKSARRASEITWSSRPTRPWRPGNSSKAGCWRAPCSPPGRPARPWARLTRSEPVQVIGTKFVLYRESHSKEKKDKIVLVKRPEETQPKLTGKAGGITS